MKIRIALLMSMAFLLCLNSAFAGSAKLTWSPNTENDLKGYNVYYGTSSRQYGPPLPVGNVTSYTMKDLKEGSTYYFAITAVDTSGNESGYSSEAVKTIIDTQSPSISILTPSLTGQYEATSSSIDLSGTASDNVGISRVTWSNSKGGNGAAAGTSAWSISEIPLLEGQNVITLSAIDTTGNQGNSTFTVIYSAGDNSPPQIAIESPSRKGKYSTRKEYLNLSGSASSNAGVKQITWRNSRGGNGIALGTSKWSASGVKLFKRKNVITVTVTDEAGNQSSQTIAVNYSPSRK